MKINSRIGDYEVLGELGRGGMGHVYRVRNVISERVDAMKVLLPDLQGRSDLAARFLREIKLLAALDHPNIAALRTALEVDNQLIMIMEYVEGQTVADRLNFGAIPVPDALIFIGHVLSALEYAHSRDVVHRDIKPANMILTPQGVVKLMDFGIARSGGDQTLTVTGSTTGSLLYMSPEQVQGKEADARSDLYSIGISLYQMVTGRLPFDADTSFAVMAAHLQQKPKPPMDVQPAVSQALNDIILKAIAKDPEQRFQSAGEFREALVSVRPTVGTAPTAPRSPTVVAAFPLPGAPQVPAGGRSRTIVDPRDLIPQNDATVNQSALQSAAPMRQGMRHPVAYMVLGGVLVIGALVSAVMYSRRAEANPPVDEPTAAAAAPVPAPAASQPAAAASPGATEAPATAPHPAASAAPQTRAGAAGSSPQPGAGGSGAAATATPSTAALPATTSAGAARAAGAPQVGAPADAAKPSSAAPTIDWDQLEDEIEQLAIRAVSINESLDRMKNEQARLGVSLRGDVAARQESMNSTIARARDAVAQKNAARAPRLVQVATSDIEFLEKFLGRGTEVFSTDFD